MFNLCIGFVHYPLPIFYMSYFYVDEPAEETKEEAPADEEAKEEEAPADEAKEEETSE